jgi:hypothetical protein
MEAPTDIQKLVDQVEQRLAGNGGLRQKGDPSLDQGIRFRPGQPGEKSEGALLVNLGGRFDAIDSCWRH